MQKATNFFDSLIRVVVKVPNPVVGRYTADIAGQAGWNLGIADEEGDDGGSRLDRPCDLASHHIVGALASHEVAVCHDRDEVGTFVDAVLKFFPPLAAAKRIDIEKHAITAFRQTLCKVSGNLRTFVSSVTDKDVVLTVRHCWLGRPRARRRRTSTAGWFTRRLFADGRGAVLGASADRDLHERVHCLDQSVHHRRLRSGTPSFIYSDIGFVGSTTVAPIPTSEVTASISDFTRSVDSFRSRMVCTM